MLKYFFLTMFALISSVSHADTYQPSLPVDRIDAIGSTVEKDVRQASVRVMKPFVGGHGSGSYIRYKDVHLVITAQHVTDGPLGATYLVAHKTESHLAVLIYSDPQNDIAILYVGNHFDTIKPMRYNPLKEVANVGTEIYYSGFPSSHSLMSFRGIVSGYEHGEGIGKRIILSTYGWFGCSGSVIYNTRGQQVGVLYGVDVEYYPNMQVQENMVWVAPINKINIEKAMAPFCRGYQGERPKACK